MAGLNPDLDLGIGITADRAGIAREMDVVRRALISGLNDFKFDLAGAMDLPGTASRIRTAMAGAEDAVGDVGDAAKRSGDHFKVLADAAESYAKAATGGSKRVIGDLGDVFDAGHRAEEAIKDVGEAAQTSFRKAENATDKFDDDLAALIARAKAVEDALRKTGQNPDLLRNYEQQYKNLIDVQEEWRQRSTGEDDVLEAELRKSVNAISKIMGQEVQIYKSTNLELRKELERKDAIIAAAANEQRATADRTQKQLTNLTQRGTTLRNAEIRTESNQAIQASQRTARTRIELLRFTFRQIQVIERSIGKVFKGTAAVMAGAFARVERTVFRIGGVFKRGNKDYTQGLSPALRRREGILKTSFRRQESTVRGSVARQSVAIQRFETQASTGIAGALTGRSSLGALFGGGIAFGGGFALFRKLSDSIQVGGDFIQGLAVLQAQLQLTEKEMVGVRQLSIDLGNDITLPGVSALDAAQAIAALAKQFGALGDAALPAAEAAAKGVLSLSRATGATAEDAAAIVGSATNVFGIAASEAVATADKVTAALTVSAGVSINDFKDAFTQGASVFSLFQKDALGAEGALVEFNTALAVLARGGLTGSQAGTGLKQFFIQSVKAGDSFVALRSQIAEAAGVTSGSIFFDADENAREFTDSIDILRKGLAGYSEEAKQSALIKLFGARASTVALNLIGADPEDFDLIREAQERQGAAAEVATAQNVGLRGALDALGSVIETQQIKTYEKWQGAAAKVTLKLADLFQAFFDGTGIMANVRTAITGVTIALGGLLALKASFELFKFLGIGLSALISPLGLVIVGVAALGATFALLLKSSESFGTAVKNIGGSLASAVVPVLEFVGDLLARFFNLLDEHVVPSIVRFSVALAESLGNQVDRFISFLQADAIPALIRFKDAFVEIAGPVVREVFDFIKGVVNPVLERLGQLIEIVVVPSFNKLADTLRGKVEPAIQKVRDVAGALRDEIGPLIQPATDAFQALGDVIGAIAGKRTGSGFADTDFSDLSALIPAFQDVVSGIAQSFANIAERIIEVVGPQIPIVIGWIASQFSEDKLIAIVASFGRVAQGIGKALGAIATSPEFLGAIVAIAATGGFLAVKFLQGFLQGVVKGLGRTFDVLEAEFGDSVRELLGALFDPKVIALAVLAGFALITIGSALRASMQAAGQKGGRAFARGMVSGTSSGIGSARSFTRGLFGGVGAVERESSNLGRKSAQATQKAFDKSLRDLRALGDQRPLGLTGQASEENLKTINEELATTKGRLTEAGAAGALAHDRIGKAFSGIADVVAGSFKSIAGGVGKALTGGRFFDDFFKNARTQVKDGFVRVRNAVGDGFRDATQTLQASSVTTGQAIGTGLMGGIISGISGQAAGTSLSRGDTGSAFGGIAGILAGVLIASTVPGFGPLLAGAALAVGGVTTALSFQSTEAATAKAEIQEYTDAIAGAKTANEEFSNVVASFASNLSEENADTILFLDAARFNPAALADNILNADLGLDQLKEINLTSLAPAFGDATADFFALAEGATAAGKGADFVIDTLEKFGKGTITGADLDALRFDFPDQDVVGQFDNVIAALREQGFEVKDLTEAWDFLNSETGESLQALDVGRALQNIEARDLSLPIREVTDALTGLDGVSLRRLNAQFDHLTPPPVVSVAEFQQAIDLLNQERLTDLNSQLSDLTTELDFVKSAADSAREELALLIRGDYAGSLEQAINRGILAIPQIGSALAETLKDGSRVGLAGQAEEIDKFRAQVSAAVSAAITIDPDIKLPELQALIGEPFGAVIDELEVPEATKEALRGALSDALTAEGIEAQVGLVKNFDDKAEELQTKLDSLNLEIQASVLFSAAQINDALARILGAGGFTPLTDPDALERQLPTPVVDPNAPPAFAGDPDYKLLVTEQAAAAAAALAFARDSRPDVVNEGSVTNTFNNDFYISNPNPAPVVATAIVEGLSSAAAGRRFADAGGV